MNLMNNSNYNLDNYNTSAVYRYEIAKWKSSTCATTMA
jgi:hypothetical protein